MNSPVNEKRSNFIFVVVLAAILLVAAGYKALIVSLGLVPFNADEAIVGLMAGHILKGETPLFFYGQAYMGSLDAYLVAAGFALFGRSVAVIRLVQAILYLLTIITTVFLGRAFWGSTKAGLIAGGLLAIPTVNLTLYTTASLGGYGEALLIGNLVLLCGWNLAHRPAPGAGENRQRAGYYGLFLLWGFLAGLGFWANALSLIYSLPVGVFILWRLVSRAKKWGWVGPLFLLLVGLGIGSCPWWIYASRNGLSALIGEILGQAVAVESGAYLKIVWDHFFSLIVLGIPVILGLRPPWNVSWLGLPLIPFVLILWGSILIFVRRFVRADPGKKSATVLIGSIISVLLIGFVFTSFGVDPSGRYFLPVSLLLALIAGLVFAHWIEINRLAVGGFVLLVAFQVYGNWQSARANPPGFTTQFYEPARLDMRSMSDLVAFLRENDLTRGYSNYWVSYPLAFLSEEELIYTPELPYHPDLRYTARDNRYQPYNELVVQSDSVAYITGKNPLLDERLRAGFAGLGVTWQEKAIGDFHVYYNLSAPVRPGEIDLSPPQ